MDNGNWIKLNRKMLENPIMKKPLYGWLWIILLLKANHKDTEFIWNNEKQICRRGELITGRKQLSIESSISESQIERVLDYFERECQIEQQKNNKFRLILIKNYDKYQDIGQQKDNRRTTEGQQKDTNKNDKNNKKDNNINIYIPEASSGELEIIPDLLLDKQKHIQIIGLFAKAKKVELTSKELQSSFIRRNLRAAKDLSGYPVEKIIKTLKYLIDNVDFKWTLESVGKYIDEDLTAMKTIGQSEDDIINSIINK